MKKFIYVGVVFIVIISSCRKIDVDRDINQPVVYDVPAMFQIYVDSFIAAGEQRGDTIVIDDLVIDWEAENEDLGGHTCAVCVRARNNERSDTLQKYIVINKDCWNDRNKYSKEVVIFHELGHCYLNRKKHTNGTIGNGYVKSIMNNNIVDTIWGDSSLYRRVYYLNELFSDTATTPDWAQ